MMNERNSDKMSFSPDYREKIHNLASRLADLLSQSPEYGQFVKAKQKLEADEEKSSILNDLRQQQMALRMASFLGEDIAEDKHDFENMFLLLSQEPSINDYLFAEDRFLRLLADIEEVLSSKLDIWQDNDDLDDEPVDISQLN